MRPVGPTIAGAASSSEANIDMLGAKQPQKKPAASSSYQRHGTVNKRADAGTAATVPGASCDVSSATPEHGGTVLARRGCSLVAPPSSGDVAATDRPGSEPPAARHLAAEADSPGPEAGASMPSKGGTGVQSRQQRSTGSLRHPAAAWDADAAAPRTSDQAQDGAGATPAASATCGADGVEGDDKAAAAAAADGEAAGLGAGDVAEVAPEDGETQQQQPSAAAADGSSAGGASTRSAAAAPVEPGSGSEKAAEAEAAESSDGNPTDDGDADGDAAAAAAGAGAAAAGAGGGGGGTPFGGRLKLAGPDVVVPDGVRRDLGPYRVGEQYVMHPQLGAAPLLVLMVGTYLHEPTIIKRKGWGRRYSHFSNHFFRILGAPRSRLRPPGCEPYDKAVEARSSQQLTEALVVGFIEVCGVMNEKAKPADIAEAAQDFLTAMQLDIERQSAAWGCTCGKCGAPAFICFDGKTLSGALRKAWLGRGVGVKYGQWPREQLPPELRDILPPSTEVWVMPHTSARSRLSDADRYAVWEQLAERARALPCPRPPGPCPAAPAGAGAGSAGVGAGTTGAAPGGNGMGQGPNGRAVDGAAGPAAAAPAVKQEPEHGREPGPQQQGQLQRKRRKTGLAAQGELAAEPGSSVQLQLQQQLPQLPAAGRAVTPAPGPSDTAAQLLGAAAEMQAVAAALQAAQAAADGAAAAAGTARRAAEEARQAADQLRSAAEAFGRIGGPPDSAAAAMAAATAVKAEEADRMRADLQRDAAEAAERLREAEAVLREAQARATALAQLRGLLGPGAAGSEPQGAGPQPATAQQWQQPQQLQPHLLLQQAEPGGASAPGTLGSPDMTPAAAGAAAAAAPTAARPGRGLQAGTGGATGAGAGPSSSCGVSAAAAGSDTAPAGAPGAQQEQQQQQRGKRGRSGADKAPEQGWQRVRGATAAAGKAASAGASAGDAGGGAGQAGAADVAEAAGAAVAVVGAEDAIDLTEDD
ncbi:hypothetical protein HYH02_010053 [Chlamydomonas schloesseri]|uniref:Uncharacterized protein n=1 Tax=Chlamydomonas schloesseri TaxID=2026947 RepID=A0A835W8E2_9CHLO|nr:hypothetical protein HYH02_010053 [Chlamydomonas schloesseri]|eukprot:KAG2441209.1 hypothetical protein HYH02_010053 [Chlamydomonas schloesseri]